MFGGPLEMPAPPPGHSKPPLQQTDIFMPRSAKYAGEYAHRGREANTDYSGKLLHYKQRELELFNAKTANFNKSNELEYRKIEHQTHAERTRRRKQIQIRLVEKLAQHEETVEKRREKLRDILGAEEREYVRETVDRLQKVKDEEMEEMKQEFSVLMAEREKERREFVNRMRVQQYAERCVEFRPFITQKHLEESKLVQLQQMRENEVRREGEREIEKMWDQVVKKQDEAILERERQEALIKYERIRKDKEVLDMQVKAKRMLEQECKAVEEANRIEMQKLRERMEMEAREDHIKKLKRREKEANEIKEQIRMQAEFEAQRKKEEHALDSAFARLAQLELERSKRESHTARRNKETHIYMNHLNKLQEKKKEEEKRIDAMMEEVRLQNLKEVDAKQCKAAAAKQKLLENVMEGRRQQLEEKRKEMQLELEQKQKENEIFRNLLATNEALNKESERLAAMAAKTYQSELKQQMEYNAYLRMREKRELQKKLQQGIEEENRYMTIVKDIVTGTSYKKQLDKHPFRKVVEQFDCSCEKK